MKLSINFQDQNTTATTTCTENPTVKAKLPISILNRPFNSTITTVTNSFSNLTFSLSTNFSSGPSLKLIYSPVTATSPPFSFSLKSGLGLLGSPQDSPLVFSVNFSLSSVTPNLIIPSFSLQFKPQLGHFSLHRKTAPNPNPNPNLNYATHFVNGWSNLESGSQSNSEPGNGFASDGSLGWQEVKLEPLTDVNGNSRVLDGIGVLSDRKKIGGLSGVSVKARTVIPLSRRLMVNCRWDMNFPGDLGIKMPYLTVNKIGLERVEEGKEIKEKTNEISRGDSELLKGMCFWMRRDLEILEKDNREMKQYVEETKSEVLARNLRGGSNALGKNVGAASRYKFEEFEQRRDKINGGANVQMELKKPGNIVTDLESELQRAIKAAAP
ncbi:uncharacterized protein LOC126682081 [Mercurialis annua]|uniref:uncharacterized protein LOC126682081 n=1 Tax=Mercurialis annua TaxID=3986 RepID=UPI00215E7FDF|nr:uncharacterized protein LOC126682081 [Mercurialis annua]